MKKLCTPRNLKLLLYAFIILYCVKISLPISTPIVLAARVFTMTILYVLFLVIDLDIFKRNLYRNAKQSGVVAALFAIVSYVADSESFWWFILIGIVLLIVQYPLFTIKSQFSVRLLFERCGQFFLFSIIQIISWRLIIGFGLIVIDGELIYDGVEVMVLSGIGFIYFWIIDTFVNSKKDSIDDSKGI